MAFPWLSENGLEGGTRGTYDAEAGPISFPSYRELARFNMAPYRGAYSAKITLTGGTTSAFIREDGDLDSALAADGAAFLRFYCYVGQDLVMAVSDKFSLFEAESVLDTTTEVACGLQNAAGILQFWVNQTAAAATPSTYNLGTFEAAGKPNSALGKWYAFELAIVIDNGVGNDGTITGYVDGVAMTAISSLNQAAIVNVKLGAIGPDAGTIGTILLDEIRADDARVYPYKERFPQVFQVTKNEHIFVGPGCIESAGMLSTGASDVMTLWDTDRADVLDTQGFKVELNNAIHSSVAGPIFFEKGCYAVVSGTNPRGQIALIHSADRPGVFGPKYYSQRGMIMWGARTA